MRNMRSGWPVLLLGFAAISASVASAQATVDFALLPASQVAEVSDVVGIELWAYPSETVEFNSAQAILTWDTDYLQLVGNDDPAYPPPPDTSIWDSGFPAFDSFGLNEAAPLPQDGNGLWVGEVDIGQTLPAAPGGILLTTLLFDALAETPSTLVTIESTYQLNGKPMARSKFNVGTYNLLDAVGDPAEVIIIPEPAGLTIMLALLAAWRRR